MLLATSDRIMCHSDVAWLLVKPRGESSTYSSGKKVFKILRLQLSVSGSCRHHLPLRISSVENAGLKERDNDWLYAREIVASNLKRRSLLKSDMGFSLHKNLWLVRCSLKLQFFDWKKGQEA